MKNQDKGNYFQGMEHLIPNENLSRQQANQAEGRNTDIGHRALKRELLVVISLMAFFFLILVGLMMYDNNSTLLSTFAQKISNTFTN